MASINAIAKAIKKLGTADSLPSVPAVARELGETLDGGFVRDVYDAEPVAFPQLKLKATQAGVVAGRKSGLRFERIAARTGLSVAEVKELAEAGGVLDLYTGRGRRGGSNGNGAAKPKATSGRRGRPKKEEPKGTSGRRGRAAKPAAEKKVRGRRGTRASANPS